MAGKLILVLGDQLTLSLPMLQNADKFNDTILMAEVREEATYVKHHKKKIVFLFSAMRHFAQALRQEGFNVRYIEYDDAENPGSLFYAVKDAVTSTDASAVEVTQPGEFRLDSEMKSWEQALNLPVIINEDARFMASIGDFATWAEGRKQYRMEYFYREMRKRYDILMENGKPIGGKWNYDQQNRATLPAGTNVPKNTVFPTNAVTQQVIALVDEHFPDHMGSTDGFHYGVTREDALHVLDRFIAERISNFGTYQDAMLQDEPWLYHSHISLYLNCGLLTPREIIKSAEVAYLSGQAPLNSAEGFIRQILGWREYVRGFYWYFMPQLKTDNYFDNHRPLPDAYWTAQTNMNCMRQCVKETKENAYAHHIQRLMVLGNFSLLAELSPEQVQDWYLSVYADAYEWVELPNVAGMILYSDGGNLASKPYVASGSYINKMSNYCGNCGYKVNKKVGDDACPFNYLYWHFIDKHKGKLKENHRMGMILNTYHRMKPESIDAMNNSAERFLSKLDANQEV